MKITQVYIGVGSNIDKLKNIDMNPEDMYADGGRIGLKDGEGIMKMASMEENEREFMRLVEEFMEQGFSQQEAIEEAKDTLERKSIATGGRAGFKDGEGIMQMASDPGIMDERNELSIQLFKKPLDLLTPEEMDLLNDEAERLTSKFMADGGRVNYQTGGITESRTLPPEYVEALGKTYACLLYTSDAADD